MGHGPLAASLNVGGTHDNLLDRFGVLPIRVLHNEAVGTETLTLEGALRELDRMAPNAPFLALGQTVFWDEPMKAGVALAAERLGSNRTFTAGIHDTDYFAKLPSGSHEPGQFQAVPHNDTSTKGLWSAAAEFSALFGSETIVAREILVKAGLRLEKILHNRPKLLDEATEAWGWRGIVSLDENPPISAEVPLEALYPELKSTLEWAVESTLASVCAPQKAEARARADRLFAMLEEARTQEPNQSLAAFYRRILPGVYSFCAGHTVSLNATRTTELLQFNRKTSALPRFDLLNLFVSPESAELARECYNEAISGSEIYGLDRFGTGAIPFDLVIPGLGRGTIRVAPNAIVVMTPKPVFISLQRPLRHVQDLAEAVSKKLGDDTVVIGKAVTLLGMLAREFVFVFHEGASSYVKYTRKFHGLLQERGLGLNMNPILRVRLDAWTALQDCKTWIRLPEPFQRPFGTEELTAPSFSSRWREVGQRQEDLLGQLGNFKSPLELIRFLEQNSGGSWHCLSNEYRNLHDRLDKLESEVNELKSRRRECYKELKKLKQSRGEAERKMGDHFRSRIFEKSPTAEEIGERERLRSEVDSTMHAIAETRGQIRHLLREQDELASADDVRKVHERRRAIEIEAELKRLRLIREAVITSKGLAKASHRPSAWWFPVLCPDGGWFEATIERAECYLEPLVP